MKIKTIITLFLILISFNILADDTDSCSGEGGGLDIPAGTAVRFEPGQSKEITLIPFEGKRAVYGFNQAIMTTLDEAS